MLKTDTRQANWRRANPGKYDAHLAVQRAVKAGALERWRSKRVRSAESKQSTRIMINTTTL